MTRARSVEPGHGALAFSFGMLAERPGTQLDLVAEAGVETLSPTSIRVGRILPTRRACTYCPKRALAGRYECAEHDDGLPYGEPIDRDPGTPGGLFHDLPIDEED